MVYEAIVNYQSQSVTSAAYVVIEDRVVFLRNLDRVPELLEKIKKKADPKTGGS
jgi:hypothetical protein